MHEPARRLDAFLSSADFIQAWCPVRFATEEKMTLQERLASTKLSNTDSLADMKTNIDTRTYYYQVRHYTRIYQDILKGSWDLITRVIIRVTGNYTYIYL